MIEIRQEPERVPVQVILMSVVVVCGVMIAMSFVVLLLYRSSWFERGGRTLDKATRLQVPEQASQVESHVFRLQTAAERGAHAAHIRLQRYGWVDRSKRRVHLPLSVATELYLAEPGVQP
jgi:hypothetical protein